MTNCFSLISGMIYGSVTLLKLLSNGKSFSNQFAKFWDSTFTNSLFNNLFLCGNKLGGWFVFLPVFLSNYTLIRSNNIKFFMHLFKFTNKICHLANYSTTPLSRTLKWPKKLLWLNGSLTYPNFILSQTLII